MEGSGQLEINNGTIFSKGSVPLSHFYMKSPGKINLKVRNRRRTLGLGLILIGLRNTRNFTDVN